MLALNMGYPERCRTRRCLTSEDSPKLASSSHPPHLSEMNLHHLLRLALSASALLLTQAPLAAQDSTATRRPHTWSAVVDLAFSAASGNDRTTLLSTGFQIKHLQTQRFELEWTGSVRYGRSEGREVARNLKSGLSLNPFPAAMVSPYFKITGERDPFRKLSLRSGGQVGAKYTPWRSPRGTVFLTVTGLYSYESFFNPDGPPLAPRENARWSIWFNGNRKISDLLSVEHSTTYEPIWNQADEYLLRMISSINVPMSSHLALLINHSYERNSMAPPGVRRDDQLFKTGLTLRTRW